MAVRGEESTAMLPEPRPDFLAVGLRQFQLVQRHARKELKAAFGVNGRKHFQFWLHLEQEHEPMRVPLVAVLADEAGEVQVGWGQLLAGFLARLAASAGVRRFALVRMQFPAAWTPKAAIRFLGALQQEDFVLLVKAVEQSGNFVGQLHRTSETANGKSRKKLKVVGHLH